jgi:hypothetical protein
MPITRQNRERRRPESGFLFRPSTYYPEQKKRSSPAFRPALCMATEAWAVIGNNQIPENTIGVKAIRVLPLLLAS